VICRSTPEGDAGWFQEHDVLDALLDQPAMMFRHLVIPQSLN